MDGWSFFDRVERVLKVYRQLGQDGFVLPYPLFPEPGGLLPWGHSGNGHYFNWRMIGNNGDWDVAVWATDLFAFSLCEGKSMTGFLLDIIAGKDDAEFPSLFFDQSPLFVPNDRTEQ